MGFLKHALSYWYPELRSFPGLAQSLENPSVPLSAVFDEPRTTTGIAVNETNALSISSYYSCLKVLSETMASMDLEVVEKVGKATRANTSHPNYWLLHAEPSPLYNRFEWIQSMIFFAAGWGNGYSEIIRDRFANAKEFKLLPEWEVDVKMTERGKVYYEHTDVYGNKRIILSENMIHLKNIGTSGIVGFSTAHIQREAIANALAKQQHEGAFYSNGAKASGILMTPGTMGTKEQQNLKGSFEAANSGAKNRFKTIVLEEGVKYQQLTIPQNDAQFLESKKFDRSEIAGWFRIPPHKIGDLEKANYSNIEAQDRAFAKDVAVPWAERFQQELNRKLFFENERGKFMARFNLDDLIKGDIKTRYDVYATGVQWGMLRPSEAREQEGWEMEGTESINKFFMNSTMQPVENLEMEQKPEENEQAA
ncbi:MAG: phage portal protein [Leptolyngbyaceae bacterium]|nr:phage portal protein [Leptolyngbyaceae bacterium]